MSDTILVIGAALIDIKGTPVDGLEPNTSNPAHTRFVRGGTARNVAENLGRLGASVILLTAVGDDDMGRRLLRQTSMPSVDLSHTQIIPDGRTGSYIAILNDDGTLSVALDDTRVQNSITPAWLYQRRALFRDAALIFVDGSLTEDALEMVVKLSIQYQVPLSADPSSTRLAPNLIPHLSQLSLIVPNEAEACMLVSCPYEGHDPDSSLTVAHDLLRTGVQTVAITLADYGLAYATSAETHVESGIVPGHTGDFVDATGTGDAVTAATLFGMLEGLPVVESLRLGASAGRLTLQSKETVVPSLSLDLLYDNLFS